MWIIPKNLSAVYPSAQVFGDSKEELSELSQIYEQSVMWRSKASLSKTWLRRWKQVYWLRLQFGRTLKPLTQHLFMEKYTSSLPDIAVSRLVMPVKEEVPKTLDIFIPTLPEQLTLFAPIAVSLKTSEATLPSDSEKSLSRWKEWVTECVGEYSVRRKQAQAIREKEFLSWQSGETAWKTPIANQVGSTREDFTEKLHQQVQNWATPKANGANGPGVHGQGGQDLQTMVVMNWPTPTTMENEQDQAKFEARAARLKARNNGKNGTKYSGNGAGPNLATLISWGTPTSRDYKDGTAESVKNVPENGLLGRMVHSPEAQLHDPDKFSTNGSDPERFRMLKKRLNPHWVCQLMGTDFEKIFFVHLETPCTQTQLN